MVEYNRNHPFIDRDFPLFLPSILRYPHGHGNPHRVNISYHLVMTNIAMENPNHKWRFIAGKIIYKWAIYTMAMLNNQRVYLRIYQYLKNI
jgi:hypothetical protein